MVGTGEAAGAGVAAVSGAGRGRGTRGGVLARRATGRGVRRAQSQVHSRGCIAVCVAVRRRVRVEMRFEGFFAIGGAGEPGETGADTVGPVVTTESVPCVELLEKGVGWATVVAAAGASGVRTDLGGYGKNRSQSVVGFRPNPPAAGTAVDGGDRIRNTSGETPRRRRKVVNP